MEEFFTFFIFFSFYRFIIYKLPKLGAIKTQGTEFYYIDKSLNSFEYYDKDITKKHYNPLYRTLQPIYNKNVSMN